VADLKRVGEMYLKPETASVAVITNPVHEALVKDLGLEIKQL